MTERNLYPHLSGEDARKALEQDRDADDRFEDREAARIESEAFGRKKAVHRAKAEGRRVANLIAHDRAHRAEEVLREAAEIELGDGKLVAMRDVAIGPTPEQVTQAAREGAGFAKFTPKLPDGSVATVTGYRRREVPQAYKAMLGGVIDYEGLSAAKWYSDLYEQSGLSGHYQSTNYAKEIFVSPVWHAPFTESQIDHQTIWRAVRRMIPSRHLRLLDQMIIEDVPLRRAVRAARAFHRDPKKGFREAIEHLVCARDALKDA